MSLGGRCTIAEDEGGDLTASRRIAATVQREWADSGGFDNEAQK